jgi:hypothetical protein
MLCSGVVEALSIRVCVRVGALGDLLAKEKKCEDLHGRLILKFA